MCGIVGYVGREKVDTVLLNALSRLEYRGYDSAGIATLGSGTITILKESGKLSNLRKLVQEHPVSGQLGIGHTRWATHGEPNQKNAHPHADPEKKVALVHNGIIENHAELKVRLMEAGYVFQSDTDTEVLVKLIEKYHIKMGQTLEESVKQAIREIRGTYAFCVISALEPGKFIAARKGSPLVVGLGQGENFIASDAPALIDYTRDVIFLEDDQMVILTQDGVRVSTTSGREISPAVTRIDWDAKAASKEGFDHFMLKEIEEQPQVIERIYASRLAQGPNKSIFDVLNFDEKELIQTERLIIQACGTSWHAALTAKFLFENLAGIPTEVDVSSEFRYRGLLPQKNTQVLSITQSGETIDTLMGLRQGKEKGFKTLAVCNVLGSTIARESDGVIFTHAGPEIGVASTKAYTAQIGVLFALSLFWGKIRGRLSEARCSELKEEFRRLPEKMQTVIGRKELVRHTAQKFYEARDFLFLGRGINYPNAYEGALKIKEIAYIHATGHPAGEMKHGPIALIDEKMPVVCIVTESGVYEKMVSNIQEVRARKGRVIALASDGDEAIKAHAEEVLYVPKCDEALSPLLTVLPLQYLAYYVAVLRGTDVDQPRNLAKSVTVE